MSSPNKENDRKLNLNFYHTLIDQHLKEYVENSLSRSPLKKSARYALFSEGKRLRPILTLLVIESLGKKIEKGLPIACSIEMLHTYSLIHDDLPCMDDDDIRRNQPALHCAFPEWQALLTGDLLLTLAFEIPIKSPQYTPSLKVKLLETLSSHGGANGLLMGQTMDLLNEGQKISSKKIKLIYHRKTAALFLAAIESGALIGKASKKDVLILQKFGSVLGIAFQAINDLLEQCQLENAKDPSLSSDQKKQKATLIKIQGKQKTIHQINRYFLNANLLLKKLSFPSDLLLLFLKDVFSPYHSL